ncbi:MAG: DNA internalization-related competence protein ComEC/Rec2 [Gemmatimonadota bacterium]
MTRRGHPTSSATFTRPSPLLAAALVLAAAIAVGMRWSWAGPLAQTGPGYLGLFLGLLGLLAVRTAFGGRVAPALPWLCLVAGAGFMLGAGSAGQLRLACTLDLEPGERVSVVGRANSPLPSGGGDRAFRITLRDVRLSSAGRECRIPSLIVFAAEEQATLRDMAGSETRGMRIALRGRWSPFRTAEPAGFSWPLPPQRQGLLTGAEILGVRSAPNHWLARVRGWVRDRLADRLTPNALPAALALTLAERDELSPETRNTFADAGLAHLLAISGLHIGLIALGALRLVSFLLRGPRRYAAAVVLVGLYVLMIGAPPAASRAWVLFASYSLARMRGSPVSVLDALGLAAGGLLVVNPASVADPGFQMSFAGFLGLLVGGDLGTRLGEHVAGRQEGAGRAEPHSRAVRWSRLVLASAGALAFTAPIAAAHFGRAAPVALLSNLVGAPLVGLVVASLALTVVLPGLAGTLSSAASDFLLAALMRAADFFAALPFANTQVRAPVPAEWAAMIAIGCILVRVAAGRPAGRMLPALGLALAALIAMPALVSTAQRGETLLCTLDVGQGDAAVLRTERGHWALFDTGPPSAGPVITRFLTQNGAREIDLLILSHPDVDHLGGAADVFRQFTVRRVLDGGRPLAKLAYGQFLAQVELEGATWLRVTAGDRFRLDNVAITILAPGPLEFDSPGRPRTANESSVVFRLTTDDGFRYLNTGDASAKLEADILARWPRDSVQADLLKVGHHGSKTSSSTSWLRAVGAPEAVISSGTGNRYGHPHVSVLARLASAGVETIWRTDGQGTQCKRLTQSGVDPPPA